MRYLPFLLIVGLVIYTVVDITGADDEDRLGVHPVWWILLVVLLPVLGSAAWYAVRFSRRARQGTVPRGPVAPTQPSSRGPLAPDDDPEFLWRLEQERRRREREQDPDGPSA